MVPNRLALLLQADGWWVRSEIIWAKPNPMPESVRDRPTSAHEKVFLLTKSERYFYDGDAIREEYAPASAKRYAYEFRADVPSAINNKSPSLGAGRIAQNQGGRSARNVWTIAPQPYYGAHFATMPPALAERCIKAGCPIGGSVLDPFGGAGTTGLVADRLGRNATLIELNGDYTSLQHERYRAINPQAKEAPNDSHSR
jgi:DNA modification methylase